MEDDRLHSKVGNAVVKIWGSSIKWLDCVVTLSGSKSSVAGWCRGKSHDRSWVPVSFSVTWHKSLSSQGWSWGWHEVTHCKVPSTKCYLLQIVGIHMCAVYSCVVITHICNFVRASTTLQEGIVIRPNIIRNPSGQVVLLFSYSSGSETWWMPSRHSRRACTVESAV